MAASRRLTSRDNPAVRAVREIAGDPRRHGRALLDGIHLVGEAIKHGVALRQVLVSDSGQESRQVASLLATAGGVDRLALSDALFREVTGVASPTGIAAIIDIPASATDTPAGDAVLLDAVQDAGNVGTILRNAAAAGVRCVLLGPGCAGAWTPRVLRAGQGAHFALDVRERVDLAAFIGASPVRSLATVAGGGRSLYDLDLSAPTLWLVGNEGAGLSPALLRLASAQVTIPLAADAESLNVASALAICLFEARRQRLK